MSTGFSDLRSVAWKTIEEFFGIGTFTLTANSATTSITNANITASSMLIYMPTTSNAAAAQAGLYFNTFAAGSCVANHANNAQTDRTFSYLVFR